MRRAKLATTIEEVLPHHSPNAGRQIWNANDQLLAERLDALVVPETSLNVKALPYNAAGDAQADDQAAIQAAIDDCFARGGGVVFLPAGTYLLQSGGLLMRDNVNLLGAGMYSTKLQLGADVAQPVLSDEAAGVEGAYAFGRVHVAYLTIDGNRGQNPAGREGIFTTAYYSTFEQLNVQNCQTHGIRFGFEGMGNASSQNRVTGCRINACGQAGIFLDINGIDHVVAENYIRECDYGVVIKNGGIRLVNNAIFANSSAGIQVTQTSYGSIIALNDINANSQHGIHITRTTIRETGPWSQLTIANNTILGDFLGDDNAYDAICVETEVPQGIAKLTITGNKVFTLGGENRYRYGINLAENVVATRCVGNHIHDVATARYNVGASCSDVEIDSLGGGVVATPQLPESGVELQNPYHAPMTIYLSGGGVTSVALGGIDLGLTAGAVRLAAGQTITVTYDDAPRWIWCSD